MIDFTSILATMAALPQDAEEGFTKYQEPPFRELGGTFWMPPQESTIAPGTDFVFDLINWTCYVFFVGICVALVWLSWKYRQRGTKIEYQADAPNHNTPLEVTWTVIPVLLVVGMFFLGFKGYLDLTTPPRNAYEIDVTASQWAWSFRYPNGAQSNDLYVPAGQPVKLVMRSSDVLHSLFIPAFRVKQDVVPGRYNYLWFQSDEPTGYPPEAEVFESQIGYHLFCTEYCGTDHSMMNRRVFVLEENQFEEWVAGQARWMDEIPDEELYFKAGPRIYARCKSCHAIKDGLNGIGPTWGDYEGLGDIWTRTRNGTTPISGGNIAKGTGTVGDYIGPGKLYETPEDYLRASILNPHALLVSPYGPAMTIFKGQLNDRSIDALIGMMKNLNEFDASGNHIATPSDATENGGDGG
ncbi:MAG: cytochrome c oxidase subunit II [Phycisphaerales bacterium]|nr:cytochrome c oxidase subunit II [Phycisphaerales bacterium]